METFKVEKRFANVISPQYVYDIDRVDETEEGCVTIWAGSVVHDKAKQTAEIIAEAMNIKEETNQTPRQLKEELERANQSLEIGANQYAHAVVDLDKAIQLIKEAQNMTSGTSDQSFKKYDAFMLKSTSFLTSIENKRK